MLFAIGAWECKLLLDSGQTARLELSTLGPISGTDNGNYRQQDIESFNIERARLMISLPMIYFGFVCILIYGWLMQLQTALAGPLVMLSFTGLSTTGAFNTLNTLVVDFNYHSTATAVAANNLCRCLMGAATTAFVVPVIDAIGLGWTATLIAGLWIIFSPLLWIVIIRGHRWRQQTYEKQRAKSRNSEQTKPALTVLEKNNI